MILTDMLPGLAIKFDATGTFNWPTLTNSVGNTMASCGSQDTSVQSMVAPTWKPDPSTARVTAGPPAASRTGMTLTVRPVNVNFTKFENRAPVTTEMLASVAKLINALGTVAVNCVVFMNVVLRGSPFQLTYEPSVKLAPSTVKTKSGPPARIVVGLILDIWGTAEV